MEEENTNQGSVAQGSAYAIPFAIIVAGVAIALAIYFGEGRNNNQPSQRQGGNVPNTVVDPITASDHILGNPNAKLVVVEYSDTECPFCKSFHPTMNRIMSEYGDSGKVAWVYRHFPLPKHVKAAKEAEATECANKLGGNEKFWAYLNNLFEITPANDGLDLAELPKIAKSIGLDVAEFNKCLESGEMKAVVDAGIASGNRAGVNGTPYSVILLDKKVVGGIEGAQPYERVKAQIDALLK